MKKTVFILLILFLISGCSSHPVKYIPVQIKTGDEFLVRGNTCLGEGKYSKAGKIFIKAYKNYSLNDNLIGCGSSLTGLATALFNQGREKESFLVLQAAEKYFIQSGKVKEQETFLTTKALMLIKNNQLEKAGKILAGINVSTTRLYIARAFLNLKLGNTDQAFNFLTKVNKEDLESNSFYFYTLGLVLLEKEDFSACEKNLKKALDIDKARGNSPDIAADLYALFCLKKKEKEMNTALDYLMRAFKIYVITENTVQSEKIINEIKILKNNGNKDIWNEKFFMNLLTNN